MPAWMDVRPGDEVFTIPEVVVAVEKETEANKFGSGRHRTGRVIVTTRFLGVEQTRVYLQGSLVHTEGCVG